MTFPPETTPTQLLPSGEPPRGSVRRIDLALTPIRDEAGKVVYILPEGREIDGQSA